MVRVVFYSTHFKGRNPRVTGHLSPSHQWDFHRRGLFLLTLSWARGDSISPRALHKGLLLCSQARWVRAGVEVEAKAHKRGL